MPAKPSPAGLVAQVVTRSPSRRAAVLLAWIHLRSAIGSAATRRRVLSRASRGQTLASRSFAYAAGRFSSRNARNALRRCATTLCQREVVLFVPGHVGWLRLHLFVIWGKGSAYGLGEIRR